jgi:mono/diheme cytochrome c family protein
LIIISISFIVNAQTTSTYEQVYNIFQQKCAACHNSASFSGQMDLSGSPATVYSNIVNKVPANPIAAGKGYKRIEPGNPHRSFILKKINNGLDSDVSLGGGEGAAMPQSPNAPLNNYEIELIRQWVMMGAPQTGIVVDTALINTYYNIGGINATPAPLPPPAPADGFQIHIGKVFLNKGEEKEVFLKYNPKLADDIDCFQLASFCNL